jgi:hypothetical protein
MPDLIDDNGTWVLQPDKDLADLEMNLVDLTDGSWTLIDINSNVKSVAFEDSANKLTLNAISAGTIAQLSNNAYNSARWFKPLVDSKGTQIYTSDQFIFITTTQPLSSSNPSPFGLAVGSSINPYGTGSVGQTRQCFHYISVTNESDSSSTGTKHEYDAILKMAGGGTVSNILTSSVVQMTQAWNSKRGAGIATFSNIENKVSSNLSTISASVPLYLQVGLGARQNSYSALEDAEHKQKIQFLVIRLDI